MRRAWPALLLCGATLLAYGGSLRNGFVWDDGPLVARSSAGLWQVVSSADEVGGYWRPLSRASYVVQDAIAARQPATFHAVNVVLHLGCVLLLYLLGLELFGAGAPALCAALLFAVHPLCSESVEFVTARNNLFAVCFVLASLLLLQRGHDALSAFALLLGMFSKEPAIVALPLLLFFAPWRRLWPHGLAFAVYLGLRVAAIGFPPTPASRFLPLLPEYLRLALYPDRLTIFHGIPHVTSLAWIPIAVGVVLALRSSRASRFGLAWIALNLLPIVGLVAIPSTPFAERYFYAPSVGLWILTADLWVRLPRKPAIAGGAVIAALLTVRTALRTRDWHDDLSLFRSAIAVDPASPDAHRNLGTALEERGDLAGAEAEWLETVRLDPRDAEALVQLGTLAAKRGDFATAEQRWRSAPDVPLAQFNLGRLCERTGRPAEALEHYRAFVERATDAYGGRALVPVAEERIRQLPGR